MQTNDTITVACRTLSINFDSLNLTKLLSDSNLSLNDISTEILSIVTSKYDCHIYYHSLIIDIEDMCLCINSDYDLEVFIAELVIIIMDIRARLKQFDIEGHKLIGINFSMPDNLYFTYS